MSASRTVQVCRVLRLMACVWAITIPASSGTEHGREVASVVWAAASNDERDRPVWVLDPAEPGPDSPPVGRSLFDFLVTERQGDRLVYRVPFPFTALLERIDRELGAGKQGSPLKRVLIPLNRSLQRHAAKPDYFVYPRAVVGVDSEPPLRPGSAGILLKDRLFLGYQEKAEILEVISYNEAAGRFEFQVLRDYGAGKTPKVVYANRALCTACHQNQSPIFSRPLWDETNANPAIAKLLQDRHAHVYGIPIRQGIDVPDAIDQATDRANEISAYQLLWQEGCERTGSPGDSIQCRAELFHFALLSRLTGLPDLLDRLPSSRGRFASQIAAHWNDKWPRGLKIPNPDLPNRNPADYEITKATLPSEPGLSLSRYEAGERAKIRSMFEPTILREPLAVWSLAPDTTPSFNQAITGLAGFLAAIDLERLDTFLGRHSPGQAAPMHRYQSRCEGDIRTGAGSPERVTLRCQASEPLSGKEHPGFSAEGVLYLKGQAITGGTIEQLSAGEGGSLSDLEVAGGTVTAANGRYSGKILVRQRQGRLQARLAEGHAVAELAFELSAVRDRRAGSRTTGLTGSTTLTAREDYAAVRRAIEAMARETMLGHSDVFARRPFRRAAVMKTLFTHLGMPPLSWCCDDAENMPPINVMADPVLHDHEVPLNGEPLPSALKAFDRYCVQCHHEDLAFPPNFLHGPIARIREQIRDCAERILFRLEMWNVGASARQEAPMPPATALRRLHLSPEEWAGHEDFRLLESYTKDLLASQSGKPVRLEELAAKGYDNLRACSSMRRLDQSGSERRHLGTTG